jgi:outer membrane immunogenic protein
MRKTSLLAGAALLLAGPAVAADLAKPVYKAPAFVPGFTWTGCYVGGDVGGARGSQSAGTHTDGFPNLLFFSPGKPATYYHPAIPAVEILGVQSDTAGDFSQGSSVIGGGYVGCNYQFMSGLLPGLVAGVEGDFNWTGVSGSFSAPNDFPGGRLGGIVFPAATLPGGVSMTNDTRWAASLRARLGYAIVPNVLIYGTGGRAWAATDYTGVDQFSTLGAPGVSLATSFSNNGAGWVAGGGVEWAPWSNNWILRLEYLHYEINGVSTTVTGNGPAKAPFTPQPIATTFTFGDLKLDTVRAGLSYKF